MPTFTFDVDGVPRTLACHRATLSGSHAPNSLAAIQECVAAGVDRIEIDVQFLADDSMLVFHGATLEAETTGTGAIDQLTRPDVRGAHYLSDLASPVCFLEDVVALIADSEATLQIDLKQFFPLTPPRCEALASALSPIREQVLIGSQAHWNLREFTARGFRVAFDPTLQWHFQSDREPDAFPNSIGVYGMWDDAPQAHFWEFSPPQYFESRIADIHGMLPQAEEWMVDIVTIRHMAKLSFNLGAALNRRGVRLAAWTLHDLGPKDTPEVLKGLFDCGVTTVITDDVHSVGMYVAAME